MAAVDSRGGEPIAPPRADRVCPPSRRCCIAATVSVLIAPANADPGARRAALMPLVEAVVLGLILAIGAATFWLVAYWMPAHAIDGAHWIAPLLLANLVPAVALVVLVGRRIAIRRADAAGAAGSGRLHVRLVAIFSLLASVPIILTAIAASIMFQSGVQFWESDRARSTFELSMNMVRESQKLIVTRWTDEGRVMAGDLSNAMQRGLTMGTPAYHEYFAQQTFYRNLEQSILFGYTPKTGITIYDQFNPPAEGQIVERLKPAIIEGLKRSNRIYVDLDQTVIWVLTPVAGARDLYLYVATSANAGFLSQQHRKAATVLADYNRLQRRANDLQIKFNLALYSVALLIIAVTVWIALKVADRLVRPVDELVAAAGRIAQGDLSARVAEPGTRDEIATLAVAFNTMTGQLATQTGALLAANDQLEGRRALIEAVVSGVSAGVISIDAERRIRLINRSALTLLRAGEAAPENARLADIAPELDALLDSGNREAVIQVIASGEARTLAVKIAAADAGPILTFDDITQQLLDQRRAAWSDVARRIAHEIKNPLTPIQLAAERLQRRYGRQITGDDGTFGRLTETIVRQVGDLRRMVDEFSSFARMPKPVFREESLLDIARPILLLQEVAHGAVRFALTHDEPPPQLVCDRRQIAQALTNVLKNAVEAIEARGEGSEGNVGIAIRGGAPVTVTITDDGVGLPIERDRIVEPYMTTRPRGTGLGLAIVKKIVEEHCGTIAFADRPGGGTVVTMAFDADALAQIGGTPEPAGEDDARAPVLTRMRK